MYRSTALALFAFTLAAFAGGARAGTELRVALQRRCCREPLAAAAARLPARVVDELQDTVIELASVD